MLEEIIYNSNEDEVYNTLADYYEDEVWFEDISVVTEWNGDVYVYYPNDPDIDIISILIAEGFDLR